jgi:hypothetical protein
MFLVIFDLLYCSVSCKRQVSEGDDTFWPEFASRSQRGVLSRGKFLPCRRGVLLGNGSGPVKTLLPAYSFKALDSGNLCRSCQFACYDARARMRAKRLFICNGQSDVVPLQSAISGLLRNAKGLGIARSQGLNRILNRVQFLYSNCLDATISSESNLNPLNILNPMPLFQSALNL